jgi:hypothetical protein
MFRWHRCLSVMPNVKFHCLIKIEWRCTWTPRMPSWRTLGQLYLYLTPTRLLNLARYGFPFSRPLLVPCKYLLFFGPRRCYGNGCSQWWHFYTLFVWGLSQVFMYVLNYLCRELFKGWWYCQLLNRTSSVNGSIVNKSHWTLMYIWCQFG